MDLVPPGTFAWDAPGTFAWPRGDRKAAGDRTGSGRTPGPWRSATHTGPRGPQRTPRLCAARAAGSCNDLPVPNFCRHNRLLQNCPICARERSVELAPVLTPGTAGRAETPPRRRAAHRPGADARAQSKPRGGAEIGVSVRRLARDPDDGYRSALAPGLRSSAQAQRLADELALAASRLRRLSSSPPGLYAEVAEAGGDLEERTWLAFLIAYLAPRADEHPFAEIEARRTSWRSGKLPNLDGVRTGPRSAHDPAHRTRTLEAYRSAMKRAGSQAAAFTGDELWSAELRFTRALERLALPGMTRGARVELLVSLGALGVYELAPATLALGGGDEVTLAAKRVLGIGETMLLERRARELAEGCGVPLAALDLALYNWCAPEGARCTGGLGAEATVDEALLAQVRAALDLR